MECDATYRGEVIAITGTFAAVITVANPITAAVLVAVVGIHAAFAAPALS